MITPILSEPGMAVTTPESFKIVLNVAYDGSAYHGWQRQSDCASIQGTLEMALSKIANEPITVHAAGRTDAGVHGLNQIVHFETTAERLLDAWRMGVNSHLPGSIRVLNAWLGNEAFHARHSAVTRTYEYWLLELPQCLPHLEKRITHIYQSLDIQKCQAFAAHLIGEHDFTFVRGAHCQSKTPWRRVDAIDWQRHPGGRVCCRITANAFLHNMVRNIVGVSCQIGFGDVPIEEALDAFKGTTRPFWAKTAPPDGLYLTEVVYPAEFGIQPPVTRAF